MRVIQYKPDLSVKYAPRVPARLQKMANRITRRCDMQQAEVLRYTFEAAVLLEFKGRRRLSAPGKKAPLDAMMTVHTSARIGRMTKEIYERYWRLDKSLLPADILRRCLETMLPIADRHGMAYVMALREKNL